MRNWCMLSNSIVADFISVSKEGMRVPRVLTTLSGTLTAGTLVPMGCCCCVENISVKSWKWVIPATSQQPAATIPTNAKIGKRFGHWFIPEIKVIYHTVLGQTDAPCTFEWLEEIDPGEPNWPVGTIKDQVIEQGQTGFPKWFLHRSRILSGKPCPTGKAISIQDPDEPGETILPGDTGYRTLRIKIIVKSSCPNPPCGTAAKSLLIYQHLAWKNGIPDFQTSLFIPNDTDPAHDIHTGP